MHCCLHHWYTHYLCRIDTLQVGWPVHCRWYWRFHSQEQCCQWDWLSQWCLLGGSLNEFKSIGNIILFSVNTMYLNQLSHKQQKVWPTAHGQTHSKIVKRIYMYLQHQSKVVRIWRSLKGKCCCQNYLLKIHNFYFCHIFIMFFCLQVPYFHWYSVTLLHNFPLFVSFI